MAHLSYTRLGRRWRRMKGFRLSCYRFSARRLRLRVYAIIGFIGRCFESKRKGPRRWQQCDRSSSRRGLVARDGQTEFVMSRACMRSNSFYAEAIADCLDFIKRNSVSSVSSVSSANDVDESLAGR